LVLIADWDVGIVAVIVIGVFIIDNVDLRICAIVQHEEARFGVDMQPETEPLLVEETNLRRFTECTFS